MNIFNIEPNRFRPLKILCKIFHKFRDAFRLVQIELQHIKDLNLLLILSERWGSSIFIELGYVIISRSFSDKFEHQLHTKE